MRVLGSLLAATLLSISTSSYANIVITGTRVIYPEQQKEVNILLNNTGQNPSLAQAWIESDDKDKATKPIPFLLTPPIFRIDAGKAQTLRLIYTKEPLPKDRESLFYFNLLDIPPKPKSKELISENYLQIALSSRLKMFFRPANLKPNVNEAPKKLQIKIQGESLQLHNPTPYYLTISKISLLSDKQDNTPVIINDTPMIEPFGRAEVNVKIEKPQQNFQYAETETINDFGGVSKNKISLLK